MATVLTESQHTAEGLVSEANGNRSRDTITILSGQNLDAMTVLGKVTASGKYVQLDEGAVDGSENAAGVLYAAVDATAADKQGVRIARDAEVVKASLQWNGTINQAQKDAAVAQLEALGIIAR